MANGLNTQKEKENYDIRAVNKKPIEYDKYCHNFQNTQHIATNDAPNKEPSVKHYYGRTTNGLNAHVEHQNYYLNPKVAFNLFVKHFDATVAPYAAIDKNEWISNAQKAALYNATVDVVFDKDENQFRFAFFCDFKAKRLHIVDQLRRATWFAKYAFMSKDGYGLTNQELMMAMLDEFYWSNAICHKDFLVGKKEIIITDIQKTMITLPEGDLRTPWYEALLGVLHKAK